MLPDCEFNGVDDEISLSLVPAASTSTSGFYPNRAMHTHHAVAPRAPMNSSSSSSTAAPVNQPSSSNPTQAVYNPPQMNDGAVYFSLPVPGSRGHLPVPSPRHTMQSLLASPYATAPSSASYGGHNMAELIPVNPHTQQQQNMQGNDQRPPWQHVVEQRVYGAAQSLPTFPLGYQSIPQVQPNFKFPCFHSQPPPPNLRPRNQTYVVSPPTDAQQSPSITPRPGFSHRSPPSEVPPLHPVAALPVNTPNGEINQEAIPNVQTRNAAQFTASDSRHSRFHHHLLRHIHQSAADRHSAYAFAGSLSSSVDPTTGLPRSISITPINTSQPENADSIRQNDSTSNLDLNSYSEGVDEFEIFEEDYRPSGIGRASIERSTHNHKYKKLVKTEDNIERCTICLSEFEEDEEVRRLPCFHTFHTECIDRWLTTNSRCPLCRKDLQVCLEHEWDE